MDLLSTKHAQIYSNWNIISVKMKWKNSDLKKNICPLSSIVGFLISFLLYKHLTHCSLVSSCTLIIIPFPSFTRNHCNTNVSIQIAIRLASSPVSVFDRLSSGFPYEFAELRIIYSSKPDSSIRRLIVVKWLQRIFV